MGPPRIVEDAFADCRLSRVDVGHDAHVSDAVYWHAARGHRRPLLLLEGLVVGEGEVCLHGGLYLHSLIAPLYPHLVGTDKGL